MNSPEIQSLFIRWAVIAELEREGAKATNVAQLWRGIIGDPTFPQLHPTAQVKATYALAKLYVNDLGEYDRAINLLTSVTLPLLERDLNRSVGEWEIREPDLYDNNWYALPRALLEEAKAQQ